MPRRNSHCNRLPALRRPALFPQATVPAFIDSALVKPRAAMTPAQALNQMTDDIRQSQGLTREDMQRLGWRSDQIDALGPDANIRAQALAGASV